MEKFKLLSLSLIASVSLNVGLIAAYFVADRPSIASLGSPKKETVVTNAKIFHAMEHLSFRELVSFLTNRELIEDGYTKRDLALAALVAYHHFNLEKALAASPIQVRTLLLSKGQTIDVFPGLNEEQFEAIIRFAYQERWPLTAKGLFVHLQNQKPPREESLEQALMLTPELLSLRVLFQKTKTPQEPAVLLQLASQGNWEILETLHKEQSRVLDFSEEKRRSVLLSYLKMHSEEAAHLLLKTDFTYALKRLDDKQILDLLALLKKQSEEGSKFCLELLRSARSDAIWQAAALTLYSYAGEMPALPIDPQTVLARFAPETKPTFAKVVVPESTARFHVVQEGESLWKISRQYKVSVDQIVQLNGLENHSLFPGMTLKLPQGTGSEPPR